jgi:hypothetical protein
MEAPVGPAARRGGRIVTTHEQVTYTPTETDRKTALKVPGWAYRECMNELCVDKEPSRGARSWREAYDDVIADIQHQWDRYTERVGRG